MLELMTIWSTITKKGNRAIFSFATVVWLGCMLVYGVALNGPLFFDDMPNLIANDLVQIAGTEFDDWRVATMSSNSGVSHRPVAMFTFAVNHVVAGEFSHASLKATNLAIHLLIGALIYFFCQALLRAPALEGLRLGKSQSGVVALIAAAIWLLHPLHVSTVLYAIQRMAQLSTLFTIAGLLVFLRYRLRWAECGASTGELIAAGLWLMLLGAMAFLSKENGALLPWLMVVVEVTLFRGRWRGQLNRRLVLFGWGLLALPVVSIILVLLVSPGTIINGYSAREFSVEERLLTQGRLLWRYLGWILLPNIMDMGFFHDDILVSRSLWSPFTAGLSLVAWMAVVTVSILFHRKYPLLAFALLFYLVAHSMESSVLPLELVFEHRNYLPSVGPGVLVAVVIFRFAARFKALRLRVVLSGILGLLVVLLGVRTHAWTDEMTLARYNVINHPKSARANFFYANVLFKRFGQAGVLGLSEEATRALAVTSRHYYQQMHIIDDRDFAALVMLYQLDTLHFPGLSEENDWLGVLEVLSTNRRLQASDITALGALVGFSCTVAGESGRSRVSAMLDQLVQREPMRTDLLALKYKFMVGSGESDSGKLLASLELVAKINPHSREAAAYLAQYHGSDDIGKTYEAIRDWMQRDPQRRELPAIRRIFDN